MPFKSRSQMRYLYLHYPKIAKEWAKKYGIPKSLPKHVNKTKKK